MAKKAKKFETEKLETNDIDYGLLPGLTHVAYMNPIPYESKEHVSSGDGGAYIRSTDHEKKLHKLLVR